MSAAGNQLALPFDAPRPQATAAAEPEAPPAWPAQRDLDTRDDFEVHVISYDAYDGDGIKRLEDKGVTDCIVGFRVPYIMGPDTEPLEKKIDAIDKYAHSIIHKVNG